MSEYDLGVHLRERGEGFLTSEVLFKYPPKGKPEWWAEEYDTNVMDDLVGMKQERRDKEFTEKKFATLQR